MTVELDLLLNSRSLASSHKVTDAIEAIPRPSGTICGVTGIAVPRRTRNSIREEELQARLPAAIPSI